MSEEGVGAEDTAVLIQKAVEYQCESGADGGQKIQSLEDTVGSMKEAVSLKQVFFRFSSRMEFFSSMDTPQLFFIKL